MKDGIARRDFFRISTSGAIGATVAPGVAMAAQDALKPPPAFRLVGAPSFAGTKRHSGLDRLGGQRHEHRLDRVRHDASARSKCAAGDGGLMPLDAVVHKVRVTGLDPATKYFYRVYSAPIAFLGPYDIRRGRPFASPVHSSPPSTTGVAPTTTFSVINDTHETTRR